MNENDINKEYEEKIINGINPPKPAFDEDRDLPTTMSDEDIESVKDVMKEFKDKDLENAKKEAAGDHEGYETDATIRINSETGEKQIVSTDEDSPFITETFEEFLANHANDEIDLSINDDAVRKTLEEQFEGTTEMEIIGFISALHEYQSGTKTATETYRYLPKIMQDHINTQYTAMGLPFADRKKYMAPLVKDLLDTFIHESALNKYIIDMNREMDAIYTEFGNEANKFYEESIDEKISSVKEMIEQLEASENPNQEQLQALYDMRDGLHQSISFEEFKAKAPHIKIRHIDMEKPEKVVDRFMMKYKNSKYNIIDLKLIFNILHHHGISKVDAVIFGVAFCNYCTFFKPTNIKEHVFMYYTITNIISLAAVEDLTDIGTRVLNNVKEVVSIIKPKLVAKGVI